MKKIYLLRNLSPLYRYEFYYKSMIVIAESPEKAIQFSIEKAFPEEGDKEYFGEIWGLSKERIDLKLIGFAVNHVNSDYSDGVICFESNNP